MGRGEVRLPGGIFGMLSRPPLTLGKGELAGTPPLGHGRGPRPPAEGLAHERTEIVAIAEAGQVGIFAELIAIAPACRDRPPQGGDGLVGLLAPFVYVAGSRAIEGVDAGQDVELAGVVLRQALDHIVGAAQGGSLLVGAAHRAVEPG